MILLALAFAFLILGSCERSRNRHMYYGDYNTDQTSVKVMSWVVFILLILLLLSTLT